MNESHWNRNLINLLVAGTLLLSGSSYAASLGSVRDLVATQPDPVSNAQGAQWDAHTDHGMHVRINLLRNDILRIQAGMGETLLPSGDKAASIVVGQYADPVKYAFADQGDHYLISTDALALRIYKRPMRFALYRADNQTRLWEEARPLELSDKASVQTLSSDATEHYFGGGQQNGAFEFKGKQLEVSYSGGWEEGDRPSPAPFLMSSHGWGMLRNTWSNGAYDLRNPTQISLLHQEKRFDGYYFVGADIKQVVADYTELTGRARMLPRWGYEFGDADCYNDGDNVRKPGTTPAGWSDGPTGTTPDVVDTVAKKYREYDMPGGWILPNDGYGCGYTDLHKVVAGLKDYGFKTGLWTENGVEKIAHEVGVDGTRVQKLDVAWTGQGYTFSLDANQAAYKGILDNSDSRPFIWTVMGWAGTQRYAVTWTGDQSGSWNYIRWHIPTLIGSGLSGQVYATGDVDGIFGGSPETYTRDLQWKSFTPVLMGMSGWSAIERKHPWWFEEPYRSINRKYLKLKMRLMPYMYTLAHEAEVSGAPIVRGLMWDHPSDPSADTEQHKYQYLLGQDMLVAPVYRSQAASGGWRRDIYLPEGRWIDYWDGRVVDAGVNGRTLDRQVTLDTLPIFVRAGAILPMYPEALYDGQKPKDELTLDLYPAGDSQYTLYEDDGNTRRYQQGESSRQRIHMQGQGGDVALDLAGVDGHYAGQEPQRRYVLLMHTRIKPVAVTAQGAALPALVDETAFAQAEQGWWYDAADRYGTVKIKLAKRDIRQPVHVAVQAAAGATAVATADFPAAPALGREVPADSLLVINRPAEEPGHALENVLGNDSKTWFRTKRDQEMRTGPHEWVLGLGERRLINGIDIAPRTDANWKYGQIRDYEVYLGDNNGDWGTPVKRGHLALQQGVQHIEFTPTAGRLLRFRVVSVYDPDGDASAGSDPMVTAAQSDAAGAKPFNALEADNVPPITLSMFHVLELRLPEGAGQPRYLSDQPVPVGIGRDKPASGGTEMRMNGLWFHKGLGVHAKDRIGVKLNGAWQMFRADVGIDDSCRAAGGMVFQVLGDGKLIYSSGKVVAPAVVKPELDVRGLHTLELRSLAASPGNASHGCGNWANASLIGDAAAKFSLESTTPRRE